MSASLQLDDLPENFTRELRDFQTGPTKFRWPAPSVSSKVRNVIALRTY